MNACIQGFNFITFVIGYFCLSISIIDIVWGIMPMVSMTIMLVDLIVNKGADQLTPAQILVYVLIMVWGGRLAIHIGKRYHGEDVRYLEFKKIDGKCPEPFRGFLIWFKVFFMQALMSVVICDSAYMVFKYSQPSDTIGPFEIAGLVLWLIGYTFEVIGDW